MEKFIEEYRFKLEQTTLKDIQYSIEQLLMHCNKSILDVNTRDIREWMNHMYNKGYAQTTVYRKFYRIKRFFQYCVEEGIIINSPLQSLPVPKLPQQLPRYLTREQLTKLRQHVSGKLKERAVVEVLYATGVRVSELCRIKKEDINWSERSIQIRKGKGKRERIVLFTKECEEYLKAYLENRQDILPFIFLNHAETGPTNSYGIQHFFRKYSKKLNFYVSPHMLRHTFAAHLAIKGMPLIHIQLLLGHEEPRNTQIYTLLYNEARKQMYDEWM